MFSTKFGDGVETDLVPSSGGVFELSIDGKLMYSKQKTGRFPDKKEIDEIIAAVA